MENSAETAEMTKGIWFCIKALSTTQTTWDNNYDTMLNETKLFYENVYKHDFNFEEHVHAMFIHPYICMKEKDSKT